MSILFCNIAWMEYYQGPREGDLISSGGAIPVKHGWGNEMCNFLPEADGKLYGYVHTHKDKGIDISKLGAAKDASVIDGVTVVWTASAPDKTGTFIVGWYKNAKVFRVTQKVEMASAAVIKEDENVRMFQFETLDKNGYCLPLKERITKVPRRISGGMGTYPVWYSKSDLGSPFAQVIATYINSETFPNVWSPAHESFGQDATRFDDARDSTLRFYQNVNYE